MLKLVFSEGNCDIADAITTRLRPRHLDSTEHIAVDAPSTALLRVLKNICPNLLCISWDPCHVVFRYESDVFGDGKRGRKQRRTKGASFLRRIMHTFKKVSDDRHAQLPPYFNGEDVVEPSAAEARSLHQIANGTMNLQVARRILRRFNADTPFLTRAAFLKTFAAFVRRYWKECKRQSISEPEQRVSDIMASYVSPGRVEWLFNQVVFVASLSESDRALFPSGTSGNEALHAELKNTAATTTFRYEENLEMAMACFGLGKLLAHNQARSRQTLRALSQAELLALRCKRLDAWNDATWMAFCTEVSTWCEDQQTQTTKVGPVAMLVASKTQRKGRVAAWVAKRPASRVPRGLNIRVKKVKGAAKRTVFKKQHPGKAAFVPNLGRLAQRTMKKKQQQLEAASLELRCQGPRTKPRCKTVFAGRP